MPDVVFVVPYALETTLRFVRGVASLPGVRLGLLSQEAPERFPEDIRALGLAHRRVKDALDPDQIARGVQAFAAEWGGEVRALLGILEQLQEPLAEVRERLGIRGMDRREARNFRDKARMKEVLREAGLPCARHHLATGTEDALAFASDCGFPLVVKPPAGAGAKNTERVDRPEELAAYLRTTPATPAAPVLLEEFVIGEEHSFDSISVGGEHVFHSISRYYPTPLEVMETPWLQWCVLLPREINGPEYADVHAAGRAALDALGMVNGMSHMEWFRRPDGSLAISEVGARPPGAQFSSLISYAHDRDFYKAWGEVSVFERFDPPERRWSVGAAYLRGQGEGRVARVEGLEKARAELGELVCEARIPKRGQGKAQSYEGEGYLILRHPETEVVAEGLKRAVQTIRIELA